MALTPPVDQTQQRVLNPPHLDNIWPNNQPRTNIYGVEQAPPLGPRIRKANPGVSAVLSGAADDVSDAVGKGNYLSAAGKGLRGALAMPVALAHDHANRIYEGLRGPVEDVGRGALGMEDRKPAPAVPTAAPKPSLAYEPNPTDIRLANGTQRAPGTLTDATPSIAAPTNQLAPGVFTHGRGQYSDKADGMGFGSFTGQPNAQNLAAADALSSRSQGESLARVTAASQPQRTQRDGLMDQLQSREIGARKTARYALAAMDQRDQNLTAQRGQDLSYDSAMRGHDVQLYGNKLTSASSRAKLQYDMAKDQRDYNLNVEKFGVEKSSNSLKQREASDKAMREQVLGQLPQVKDATGKMVPDERGAAEYMRSAYNRLDQRKTALTKELQANPGNKDAAAELQSIGNYGLGTLSSDPQAQDQFLLGMQARSAARSNASWWNPLSADRAAGAASGPITSLKWDPDSLLDGYRDQDNNWIPAHVIDQGGSRFGARTGEFDLLKRKD